MIILNKSRRMSASIKSMLVISIGSFFSFNSMATPIVFSDADADISDTVAAFQLALGNPNNGNSPGLLAREEDKLTGTLA